jgi:DNA-binding response OmpR family regulator
VLIADDFAEVRTFLTALLRREGFATREATDGVTALQIIQEGLVDAALIDVRMPNLNGKEVLRATRGLRPELPVIMLTGLGSAEEAEEMLRLGARYYLTKPVPNRDLVEALRQVLGERVA